MANALPRAVRRAARNAEREHAQIYGQKPQGTEPEAKPAQVVQLAPEDAMEEFEPTTPAELVEPAEHTAPAEPTEPAEPTAPAELVEPAEPTAPIVDWEQKYRSQDGMLKSRDREIAGLQATLAAITSARGAPHDASPEQPTPPAPERRRLKPEDVESYGEDFIRVMKDAAIDAAQEHFRPELEQLRAENAKLRQQLGGVEQRSARSDAERAQAFLDQQVPDWQRVNEDEGFLAWLAEKDPFAGVTRQSMLDNASANNDGPRIAAFFTGYLTQSQALRGHQEASPVAQPQAQSQPAQHRQQPTIDKASLVAPGRPSTSSGNGAGAATDNEEPKFFTDRQVADFYRAVTSGKFKTNPKEKDRIEREIHRAAMAGRITPADVRRPVLG